MSVTFLVVKQQSPYFTNIPTDLVIKSGHEAKLVVSALGNPIPSITWMKDENEMITVSPYSIKSYEDAEKMVTTSVLKIEHCEQWRDSGKYTVKATRGEK